MTSRFIVDSSADLRVQVSASGRGCPFVTLANGPLTAQMPAQSPSAVKSSRSFTLAKMRS